MFSPQTSRQTAPGDAERLGLRTLEDISALILQSSGLKETLENIVRLVADRIGSEVCSIYLCHDDRLTLRATIGLPADAIGKVELAIGEGLVGYTAESRSVVSVTDPQSHPRFRLIDHCDEESFQSFVGVPLFDRQHLIGVMSVQTFQPRPFSPIEISTLTTIAFQLSTVVANANLMERLGSESAGDDDGRRAPGDANAAAPISLLKGDFGFGGVTMGPAFLIDDATGVSETGDDQPRDCENELRLLDEAFEAAKIETLCLEKRIAQRLGDHDAAIFHSHLMILQDRVLIDKIRVQIRDGRSAASAIKRVLADYVQSFRRMEDPYLRERAADIEDISRRLLSHLLGHVREAMQLPHAGIVVAGELLPSGVALLDHERILGLVLESTDSNSHVVIIAKSLGIPTIVGVPSATRVIKPGAQLIVDTSSLSVHVEPSQLIRNEYKRLKADTVRQQEQLERFREIPARTQCGVEVTLRANVGLLSDVPIARRYGAQGVGLYRTELPFMSRSSFPDRQTQYEIYRQVVLGFEGQPVTMRTLDIGGDKTLPYFDIPKEENPFLGWRSIRVSLDHRDAFRTQVEAILMAATHGPVKLMFPMIATYDEILGCKEVVAQARENLSREGWQIPDVPLGIMIEVPAAISLAHHAAAEVDFFALGTNDLIQYLMAADRGNAAVSAYYDSLHPSVIAAISQLVDVADRYDKGLCICGEMATDPACFALLVGLGLREFSVSSPSILGLKSLLGQLSLGDLESLAAEVKKQPSGVRIRSMVDELIAPLTG